MTNRWINIVYGTLGPKDVDWSVGLHCSAERAEEAAELLRGMAHVDGVVTATLDDAVRMLETHGQLVAALNDFIEIEERDARGDPDCLASEEWHAEALAAARAAVAQARGERHAAL